MLMEGNLMNNDEMLTKQEADFKDQILKMENESLSNIVKTDDKVMVTKIVKLYEESLKK